jgi:hypothetical protein
MKPISRGRLGVSVSPRSSVSVSPRSSVGAAKTPPPEMKTYVVTNVAGPYVASKRVKPGQQMRLTERQAKYERDRGLIRPATSADLTPAAMATKAKA